MIHCTYLPSGWISLHTGFVNRSLAIRGKPLGGFTIAFYGTRGAAGGAGAAGAEGAQPRAEGGHARLWHRGLHPASFRGPVAGGRGLALSCAAPHGPGRAGASRLGPDGEQTQGALLQAHRGRPQAARAQAGNRPQPRSQHSSRPKLQRGSVRLDGMKPAAMKPGPTAVPRAKSAALVGAGILLSRLAGLLRESIFAHYFGNSDAADAFKAAFRIPNLLQNLFGEGVLSASFIPVYAALLAEGDEEHAGGTAGAVLALLALATAALVLVGVLATPWLIDAIAPGFHGAKRVLTIELVRILFPGAGLLVLSAWCLGILNSHRRFFISYIAPVVWNGAMIATLLGFGRHYGQFPLAVILAWGSVAGSALQVAVQWPAVRRLLG